MISTCWKADGEQSVRAETLVYEHEIGACVVGLLECVIAEEDLIAAIEGVECLLAPGAILVVLVHAEAEGANAGIIDTLQEVVVKYSSLFGHGIVDVLHAYVRGGDGLLEVDLKVAASETAEGAEPFVFALLCLELKAEVTATDQTADLADLEVLTVCNKELLLDGRGELKIGITGDLTTKVNEDMVIKKRIRSRNSAVKDEIFLRSFDGCFLLDEGCGKVRIGVFEGVIVVE